VKITDAIAVEHGTLLGVFEEVERVLPGLRSAAEVGTMATILEGLLRTHAQLEINFAFVVLDHTQYHKRRPTTLHQDHRELDERLRQVHQAPTCGGARRLLRAAMRASQAHFRDEERRLFPAVERALGLGVVTALGEAFKKASKAKTKRAHPTGLAI
jgi:iron-sulfur cluster repair protein YtfE (RIC family)